MTEDSDSRVHDAQATYLVCIYRGREDEVEIEYSMQ